MKSLLRPRLFKRWIALSTGKITIQPVSIGENTCNYTIRWIVIYPMDSAIPQLLNNRGQEPVSRKSR